MRKKFRINEFNVTIDTVWAELCEKYDAKNIINSEFKFLWLFESLPENELVQQCEMFLEDYASDVSKDLTEGMKRFKRICKDNFQPNANQDPLELLNDIYKIKLETLFPFMCIALRIFCSPLPRYQSRLPSDL